MLCISIKMLLHLLFYVQYSGGGVVANMFFCSQLYNEFAKSKCSLVLCHFGHDAVCGL